MLNPLMPSVFFYEPNKFLKYQIKNCLFGGRRVKIWINIKQFLMLVLLNNILGALAW